MPESGSLFLDCLERRVLVFDGAMGTSLHGFDLPLSDYRDLENCSEILNETRPDVVEQVHRGFLEVGCDAVETNTFGANRVVLAEYGLAGRAYELNVTAARIARRAVQAFSTPARPRFVAGSVGPGTRLVSLRQISYDDLLASYTEQIRGLLDGGVDVVLIETCQDILQAKTAVQAARQAFEATGRVVPLMCQVTMESTGTMLVGTDLAAAVTALEAYPEVAVIGLNCATGPQEMSEHIRYLSAHCSRRLSVLPNAGLPQLVDGCPVFPLTPNEMARWLREFVETDGVNIVGGCCGTTAEHLAAIVTAIDGRAPAARQPVHEPAASSLYQSVTLRQDRSFLIVGERCNSNGSRKFRRLLLEGDIESMVATATEQVGEGAHVLDVCVDCVGRDGVPDMHLVIDRFARDALVPLMLDSTQLDVIEAGLKLAGGKCIVNSINLEEGEERVARMARLLRQYGAAVVALTIDEDPQEAMAKTADRKIAIAKRLHRLLTETHGLAEENIFFDCLTFPITTGNTEDRRLALETLDGVEAVTRELPNCQTILGVSNVSFGLQPAARVVLNSVFLAEARNRGLTAAIVHASKILPQNQISPERWQAALDLIYDRREQGDPLERFMGLFAEGEQLGQQRRITDLPIEDRLRQRIIDGQRAGLEADLDAALETYGPIDIINEFLLDGMKTVGELFGSGRMQLPFVLRSAETMKAAVSHLEPHMDQDKAVERGAIVLATVRGDVHDIGKNLVDIILSNNGYTVHNLGIKQPIAHIIEAIDHYQPDAVGLSGLLVKSTLVMRDDLRVLNERGITIPVLLGGAALTRRFVEGELRSIYGGPLHYAKDAFEGLQLMGNITGAATAAIAEQEVEPVADFAVAITTAQAATAATTRDLARESSQRRGLTAVEEMAPPPAGRGSRSAAPPHRGEPEGRETVTYTHPVPQPPFWGDRVVEHIPLKGALAYLNEVMLFQVQWQFRKHGRPADEFKRYIEQHVRPIYRELVERCTREQILTPQAVYGYWPANSDGDDLVIFNPPTGPNDPPSAHGDELLRFTFPRQRQHPGWCLADFWRPLREGVTDVAAFSIVTAGRRVSEVATLWFHETRFQDYLFLHGLGVEVAEALAEYIHKQVRIELDVAQHDAREIRRIFQQGYQGSRYSFGYPACPNLEDQALLMPLLRPGRIGVHLSEEYQLDPEQTTNAVITYHPQARYFNVR
ncbi:MAG: methionine synthase [Phycisphaerae bacterium]|jgi:5-methyltetrahydrofolate--homocysteine methyltransferase